MSRKQHLVVSINLEFPFFRNQDMKERYAIFDLTFFLAKEECPGGPNPYHGTTYPLVRTSMPTNKHVSTP